jgi:hypothetical protein
MCGARRLGAHDKRRGGEAELEWASAGIDR